MPTYKTPNVYVEEVPTLPPSVVPVATAVPAFIGCTEKAGIKDEYRNRPVRISSLLEYITLFGNAHPTEFTVTLEETTVNGQKPAQIAQISRSEAAGTSSTTAGGPEKTPKYLMYYSLRLFFENGGGACYIVSVGNYNSTPPDKAAFDKGLTAISKEDEPTLLLFTDAVNLSTSSDYYGLCIAALAQCQKLQDRFAIFDVPASDGKTATKATGANFRKGIGTSDLKYGAAYYPYLQTALNYHYTDESVSIQGLSIEEKSDISTQPESKTATFRTDENGLLVSYTGPTTHQPKVKINRDNRSETIDFTVTEQLLTIKLPNNQQPNQGKGSPVDKILENWNKRQRKGAFELEKSGTGEIPVSEEVPETNLNFPVTTPVDKKTIKLNNTFLRTQRTELHNAIKAALNALRIVMPPSSAIAGVYAKVDRERGVWKAPANVSLAAVIGPTVKISNDDQEALNIDATSGKSINAIRSFTGKGTLVWGARTLDGNDNEWRYIPVRRLFNLIEESIQKATAFAVFEANNAITWLKVKTIIESYLDGLWRQGALAGATQEQAYFVSVGLGQTMTPQDVLEGRMIIEIGVAAVRPAEFIILKFSHKLQEA